MPSELLVKLIWGGAGLAYHDERIVIGIRRSGGPNDWENTTGKAGNQCHLTGPMQELPPS